MNINCRISNKSRNSTKRADTDGRWKEKNCSRWSTNSKTSSCCSYVNSKETTNLTALPPHSTISVISLTLLKIYAQESALIKMIKTKKLLIENLRQPVLWSLREKLQIYLHIITKKISKKKKIKINLTITRNLFSSASFRLNKRQPKNSKR